MVKNKMKWQSGSPTIPGYFLLQFANGDPFVFVKAFIDNENILRMECLTDTYGGYISDSSIAFIEIPEPETKNEMP